MTVFHYVGMLLFLTAFFGFLNYKYIKLPHTIGMSVISLVVSLIIVVVDTVTPGSALLHVSEILHKLDFHNTLLNGILCVLLFAGAMETHIDNLKEQLLPIAVFASVGVLISTFVIGSITFYALPLIDIQIPFIWCLVFGALISPTDPIAVLSLFKTVYVPESLKAKTSGESLFNDGVGVVMFVIMLALATGSGGDIGTASVAKLFFAEAVGGAIVGAIAGYMAYQALRRMNAPVEELAITLALACNTYILAQLLHVSGPIAVVVAGLIIGAVSHKDAMSDETKHHVSVFWEGLDGILNSILFMVIGFEVLLIGWNPSLALVGGLAIVASLVGRYISIAVPVAAMSIVHPFSRGSIPILTWGGLRGGISVALALSLPDSEYKGVILAATCAVVIFSIIIQGLTMKRLVLHYFPVSNTAD